MLWINEGVSWWSYVAWWPEHRWMSPVGISTIPATTQIIGVSLSKPHTSVTALSTCVCIYLCLFGPTTYRKFQMSGAFKFLMSTSTCTSAKLCEWMWRATARLQGWRERKRERRRFKLNVLATPTATYFLNYGESGDRVTRQATSDRQLYVRWLQVCAWHDRSYIVWIPLLPHGLEE